MIPSAPNLTKSDELRLDTLIKYLESDANKKREETIFINGFDESITQDESYCKDYWHGIIAPSQLECIELREHYQSDDCCYAAIQHGKELVTNIRTQLGFDEHIATAIHWHNNDDNTTSWHYHLLGLGEPFSRLDGHHGVLQEAWHMASITQEKPVVNVVEYRLEMDKSDEITAINKQLYTLKKDRFKAVKAVALADKMPTRTSFNDLEVELIQQRFVLTQKMLKHHYAARNDSGSIGHRIAQQHNDNDRNLALVRVVNRGQSLATITANKKAHSKILAAEKKAAVKVINDNEKDKKANRETKARVTKVASISKTAKLNNIAKAANIGISVAATAATDIYDAMKQPTNKAPAKKRIAKVATTLMDLTTEVITDAAKLAAKAISNGMRLLMNKIELMLPMPRIGLLNDTERDRKTKVNNKNASSNHHVIALRDVAVLTKTRNSSYNGIAKADLSELPPEGYQIAGIAAIAASTSISVAKDIATLNPVKATTTATLGGLGITNRAIGVLGKGTKTLPVGIKMPLQVASLVPVVGNVAKAVTLMAETTLTAAASNDKGNNFEFER